MFANYDTSSFPIVKVIIEGLPEGNEFNDFLTQWLSLYERIEHFSFIFDVRNLGLINLKYCIKMSLFIYQLKKREIQYLQKSIILINDTRVKRLLDFIFILQKPVADVFIINTEETIDYYKDNIQSINSYNLNDNITYISVN